MNFEIGFGSGVQTLHIPEKNIQDILIPNEVEIFSRDTDEIKRSLNNPISSLPLKEIAKGKKNIAIVTSDITRPMPSYKVLPYIIEELNEAGISDNQITIVFGLGSHRQQTEKEKRKLVGDEVFEKIKCIDSTDVGFIHMGQTSRGTPVDICSAVAQADFRICLGNIEYHYFAGYSGGAKAIMPGVSTKEAIQSNHKMMVKDDAHAGKLKGNPLREDIEEAVDICKVDFLFNVVLDEHKQIIRAVCGDVRQAHREGCKFLDLFYLKTIPKRADIVIVSQGGHPKDINLYQTQKALDNAKHAVKDGGIIILVGSCKEGLGEKKFQEWMLSANKPSDLIIRIKEDFQLGGHKAAAIALVLEKSDIYLVSEIEDAIVKKMFMKPFKNVQDAFEAAKIKKGDDCSVILMPYGGSTLPRVTENL